MIVSSGFLLIFYANNDIFTRRKWINIFQTDDDSEHPASSDDEHPTTLALFESHHQHSHLYHKKHHSHNTTLPPAEVKRVRYVASKNFTTEHNIFIIYTKENYMLKTKFELFVKSLLKYASVKLHLHIISDEKSEPGAEEILRAQIQFFHSFIFYTLYSVEDCARQLSDITSVMMPHFSSSPGLILCFEAVFA